DFYINRLDSQRSISVQPAVAAQALPAWMGQPALLDHVGQWWVLAGKELYRFPKVDRLEDLRHVRPAAIYTLPTDLLTSRLYRIFEDSRGDIWISAISVEHGLMRWERATGRLVQYSDADGLPTSNAPFAFCEDRAGNIWIGYYDGGLVRYAAGRFTQLSA